jgi:hypothetical protein
LHTALDVAAHDASWTAGKLEHLDGEVREHWLLPNACHLFVLIQGVPYTKMAALVKSDVSFAGVGARWPQGGPLQRKINRSNCRSLRISIDMWFILSHLLVCGSRCHHAITTPSRRITVNRSACHLEFTSLVWSACPVPATINR